MVNLIDAWAWIAYAKGKDEAKRFRNIMNTQTNYTAESTLAEVYISCLREDRDFNAVLNIIQSNSKIVPITNHDWLLAAEIRHYWRKKRKGFGLMDALLLAKQKELDAKLVTGDPHFKGMKNVMFLK